jgi:hypothetical protein
MWSLDMILHTLSEKTSFEPLSLATRVVSDVIENWLQMARFGKLGVVVMLQGIDSGTGNDKWCWNGSKMSFKQSSSQATRVVSNVRERCFQLAKYGKSRVVVMSLGIVDLSTGDDDDDDEDGDEWNDRKNFSAGTGNTKFTGR